MERREEGESSMGSSGGLLGSFTVQPMNTAAFITKLYTMVEDPAVEQIVWSSKGDYFKVISPSKFSSTVLPQYFKHNNWTSFVRQLNMYGFHKVSEYRDDLHQDIWCFKHSSFYRGGKPSSHLIRRKRVHVSDKPEDAESEESTATPNTGASEAVPMEIQLERIEEAVLKVQAKSQAVGTELNQLRSSVQRQQQMTAMMMEMLSEVVSSIRNAPIVKTEDSAMHDTLTPPTLAPEASTTTATTAPAGTHSNITITNSFPTNDTGGIAGTTANSSAIATTTTTTTAATNGNYDFSSCTTTTTTTTPPHDCHRYGYDPVWDRMRCGCPGPNQQD